MNDSFFFLCLNLSINESKSLRQFVLMNWEKHQEVFKKVLSSFWAFIL